MHDGPESEEIDGPPVTNKTLPERSGMSVAGVNVLLPKKPILRCGR